MAPLSEDRYEERDVSEHGTDEVSEDRAAERQNVSFKITGIIWLIVAVIEAIIGLRVILKLLEANPLNGFVNFIYDISYPFVSPFFGIFGTPAVDGSVFEFTSLLAMFIYLLMGWGIVALVSIIMAPSQSRHVRVLHRH